MEKKKSGNVISALKCPGNRGISLDPSEFPNSLNSHFVSVGPKLASRIPNSRTHFSEYLPKRSNAGSFVFQPVIPTEIELEILSTPSNKALGLYSCPIRIMKCASKIISRPLCKLINFSIANGIYPSKLKHAKVIPIYKSEDETDPGNYRPILLLSIFNKILEKLMYHRLKLFLDKHETLYHSQYGFRERRSTEHALIDLVNQMQSNF